MYIDINYKLEKVCEGKKDTREALKAPYLKGNKVIATDGKRLAIVPVTGAGDDTDGHFSVEALKASRKHNGLLTLNSHEKTFGVQFERQDLGTFPDIVPVVDKIKALPVEYTIALNPKLLLELAQALGSGEGVRLKFKGEKGIEVTPHDKGNKAFGILMPMKD